MEQLLPERGGLARELVDPHRDRLLRLISDGAVAPRPAPRVPGYRLLRVLGEGSTGTVWAAEPEAGGAHVAIKLLRGPGRTQLADERTLTRELRASARARHRGLVRVHDLRFTDAGDPALVMDLVPGVDLGRLLASEGPLAWPRARGLLLQLCDALASAHDRGVVHRDLKPGNIIVASTSAGEQCTIVDLGLSRLLGDGVVSTIGGAMVGTPAYMSPEQIRGAQVDGRADIYALACIAHEMLAGRRPFPGTTAGELAVQHLLSPPPSLRYDGPRAVSAALRRALAKRPEDRFPDMRSFAGALMRADSARAWPRARTVALPVAALAVTAALVRPTGDPRALALASLPPVVSASAPRVTGVTTSIVNTCAVVEDGRVQCWGSDSHGRLGRGTDNEPLGDDEFPADRPALGLVDIVRVESAPNARHTCAIDRGGRLRCWGRGLHGALGRASTLDFGDDPGETLDAAPPLPLRDVSDVALGTSRTCAIARSDGRPRLFCWGRGEFGALGSGSTSDIGDDGTLDNLAPVPLGVDVLDVTAGNNHTCALLATGGVRCWGSDQLGQLGLPGRTASVGDGVGDGHGRGRLPDDPALDVQGLGDVEVVALDAAGDRTCALTRTGVISGAATGAASRAAGR